MESFPEFMQYPHFQIIEELGVLPYISLPQDIETLLPRFHNSGGREVIEDYTSALQKILNQFNFGGDMIHEARWDIRLNWNKETSLLTNIGINGAAGLDLENDNSYSCHNLAVDNALVASVVAQEYVWELLKHR